MDDTETAEANGGEANDREAGRLARKVAAWIYANDPATRALGMNVEAVGPGHACLRMKVRADMLNGHGICHGGMIFTLADSAFAFACNGANALTVAQGCDIDFVNPAHENDELVATCEERFRRGRSGIYDTTVTRADGTVIAYFRGRARKVGGALVEDTAPEGGAAG